MGARYIPRIGAFGEGFGICQAEIGPGLDPHEIRGRDQALLDKRFTGEEFDLEPDLEFVFVGPDGAHFWA